MRQFNPNDEIMLAVQACSGVLQEVQQVVTEKGLLTDPSRRERWLTQAKGLLQQTTLPTTVIGVLGIESKTKSSQLSGI